MATLQSKIRICKGIKMDKNYNNVLSYSENSMLSLCESQAHLVASANDYSFIRNRNVIQTNFTYSQCLQANYMAFQNKDYDNKWFFAFIDKVNYMSNGCAEIEYTIDSWSTWYDYWNRKACFVIREHTNNDTIGANTIPENLDVGEIICEQETEDATYQSFATGYWIAVASDWNIPDGSSSGGNQYAGISIYNNVVSGTKYYFFYITMIESFKDLLLYILRTNADGHIADIKNIFVVPDIRNFTSKFNTSKCKYFWC